jgi:hypothetical protein
VKHAHYPRSRAITASASDGNHFAERIAVPVTDETRFVMVMSAPREPHARYSFRRIVAAFDSLCVRELAAKSRARAEMAA